MCLRNQMRNGNATILASVPACMCRDLVDIGRPPLHSYARGLFEMHRDTVFCSGHVHLFLPLIFENLTCRLPSTSNRSPREPPSCRPSHGSAFAAATPTLDFQLRVGPRAAGESPRWCPSEGCPTAGRRQEQGAPMRLGTRRWLGTAAAAARARPCHATQRGRVLPQPFQVDPAYGLWPQPRAESTLPHPRPPQLVTPASWGSHSWL